MSHKVALKRKERVALDTMAFTFEKPAGFTFKAGQALDLTLLDPPHQDARGARRALSIVSAPFEDELVVATRLRSSAFKRSLAALEPGAHAEIDGPFGSLTLHSNRSRPGVFIAGGIGITPFISMLRQSAHEGREQVLKLLYSNRRPDDAAFLPELLDYERQHRGRFGMRATATGPVLNGTPWRGDRVRIDADFVNSIIVRPVIPVFYVAGSPSMVAGIRQVLNGMGIDDDDIRSEDFSGY
jgi:ferredoxin-NADP reductase